MSQPGSNNKPNPGTPLLDTVKGPEDLKKIPQTQLEKLAAEIRGEIIRVVSRNGGHLASSLGAVELIIAIHYVLNAPADKIIFDVGHQAYAHKIITGRREKFETLRLEDGLSGFPKRAESIYDDFDTGHSSTSVSAALGLACARDLAGENHNVLAVLGDGALTGGMVMEAMNHAGALKKKLIIVLNDNNMSISPNVGGLSEYLSLFTTKPAVVSLRGKIKEGLQQYLPSRGPDIISAISRMEDAIKSVVTTPSTMFEALGLRYIGPFDGHDIELLIEGLRGASNLERPVLMHVVTTKGKGYQPAEDDPCTFHGVGVKKNEAPEEAERPLPAACLESIELIEAPDKEDPGAQKDIHLPGHRALRNYSEVFGEFMEAEAAANGRLTVISAAMSQGTGLAGFFEKYPDRAFDVGIAEQHALTLAAGLAAGGFRPVAAIYSSFLQRGFDQLFHDIALQNLPVMLAVDRAGLVGEDGPTHHGGLDLSYLRLLPGFTVMAPADAAEFEAMLRLGLSLPGPSAVRYPRGPAPETLPGNSGRLETGRGVILKDGRDISLLALGPQVAEALRAAELLTAEGFSASVVNLRFIKPLDKELILNQAEKHGRILTVEENTLAGGLFGAVSEVLAGRSLSLRGLGMDDRLVGQASQKSQRASLGLDAPGIFSAALELIKKA